MTLDFGPGGFGLRTSDFAFRTSSVLRLLVRYTGFTHARGQASRVNKQAEFPEEDLARESCHKPKRLYGAGAVHRGNEGEKTNEISCTISPNRSSARNQSGPDPSP